MMNKHEQLLQELSEIDEALVPELSTRAPKPSVTRRILWGGGICAALLVGIAAWQLQRPERLPAAPEETTAPQETISQQGTAPPPTEAPTAAETAPESALETEPATELDLLHTPAADADRYAEMIEQYPLSADPALDAASPQQETLPVEIAFGDMGMEALMAYDISELITSNPWTEDWGITELPVFRNRIDSSGSGIGILLTEEEMLQKIEYTAAILGVDTGELTYESVNEHDVLGGMPEAHAQRPHRITAECDGAPYGESRLLIVAESSGRLYVEFAQNGVRMPDPYYGMQPDSNKDGAEQTTQFLAEAFRNLLQMDDPRTDCWSDRNIYCETNYYLDVYDHKADPLACFLEYWLNRAAFGVYANELFRISLNDYTAAAEHIGNYPIITADDAQALLLEGKYLSTVDWDFYSDEPISAENVAHRELVYRVGIRESYFMPYYRFYVEMPKDEFTDPALTTYGIFYVPAVCEEYLGEMEVRDGSFQ